MIFLSGGAVSNCALTVENDNVSSERWNLGSGQNRKTLTHVLLICVVNFFFSFENVEVTFFLRYAFILNCIGLT